MKTTFVLGAVVGAGITLAAVANLLGWGLHNGVIRYGAGRPQHLRRQVAP